MIDIMTAEALVQDRRRQQADPLWQEWARVTAETAAGRRSARGRRWARLRWWPAAGRFRPRTLPTAG